MSEVKNGILHILRFNPLLDSRPHVQDYGYVYEEFMTVLDVLRYVSLHVDPTLSYSWACRSGHCGLCGIMVDGKPCLSCRTPAKPEMTLMPLFGYPVKRDLVISRLSFDESKKKLRLFIEREQPPECPLETIDMEMFKTFRTVSRCVECLCCMAVCPIWRKNPYLFAGPAPLVLEARHLYDSRDTQKRALICKSAGIDLCISCGRCSAVCPQQAEPAEVIALIKATLSEKV